VVPWKANLSSSGVPEIGEIGDATPNLLQEVIETAQLYGSVLAGNGEAKFNLNLPQIPKLLRGVYHAVNIRGTGPSCSIPMNPPYHTKVMKTKNSIPNRNNH
jgi:hypothetical protein